MELGFPPCFRNREDFEEYERAREKTKLPRGQERNGYCFDCTLAHQTEMKAEGKCLYPEVRFVPFVDEDGEEAIVGVRP